MVAYTAQLNRIAIHQEQPQSKVISTPTMSKLTDPNTIIPPLLTLPHELLLDICDPAQRLRPRQSFPSMPLSKQHPPPRTLRTRYRAEVQGTYLAPAYPLCLFLLAQPAEQRLDRASAGIGTWTEVAVDEIAQRLSTICNALAITHKTRSKTGQGDLFPGWVSFAKSGRGSWTSAPTSVCPTGEAVQH
jgi:hypothetical protein